VPEFSAATPVDGINSKSAEVRAALTSRGDHVFLASDRDRGKHSGFKLYLSRVVAGKALPPEEIDLSLKEGDVTDPAVRMEGFDLLFSAGGKARDGKAAYRLYRSTTREVVGYTDLTRWEQFKALMHRIAWWILLALAALIALIYILEKWRDMTSLFHKCLAGSAILHLLALLLAMIMLIATTIEKDEARHDQEVLVSIDALAQEELAMESVPDEAELTDTTTNLETEKVESEFGAPGFEAQNEAQPVPDAAQSAKEALLVETQPAMAVTTEQPLSKPAEDAAVLKDLTATALPEIEQVEMEEREPGEAQPVADTRSEQFEPAQAMAETAKVEPSQVADSAVETPSDASQVTELQPAEPLVEQEKPTEFVESSATESTPVQPEPSAGTPPLESEMLSTLADTEFVDPNEAALEESNPANARTAEGAADPTQDLFDPGQAASNLATEQAAAGETAADTAEASQTGPADVAESTLDTGSPAVDALESASAQTAPETSLPAAKLGQDLPEPALVDAGAPQLEEPDAQAAGTPADAANEQFQPAGAAPNLATSQAEGKVASDAAVATTGDAAAVPAGGTVPVSAVTEAQQAESAPPGPDSKLPPSPPGALPEVALVEPGAPTLEERAGQPGGPPADPARDLFKPGQSLPNLATTPAGGKVAADSAVPAASDAAAVPTGGVVADSAVTETQRSESAPSAPDSNLPLSTPGALPEVALVEPGVLLLEEPGSGPAGAAADAARDLFRPGQSVGNLATTQAKGSAVADTATDRPLASAAIAGAGRDTAGNAAQPHSGLAAAGTLPDLAGGALSADLTTPGPLPSPSLPGELEAPPGLDPRGMADLIRKQRGKPGLDTIKQMGGTEGTEGSIGAAMKWLTENQEPDGRWDTAKHGANHNYDPGGTGLALLCFYGWGERHDKTCKYQHNVRRALDWLVALQGEDGYLGGGPGMMYSHAIAAIALCEAYGVTHDPKLRQPAERAIAYTIAAQHPTLGGWRYSPGNGADVSVTGWQYMALHSARMAGLTVPEEPFAKARAFLDRMGGGKYGGHYGYLTKSDSSRAMVATGMFCRQLDLVPPSDPMMQESARYLKMHPMKTSKPDLYYVYYTTLALYQHQGPVWLAWNERLQTTLPLIQQKLGATAGSWDPSSSMTADGGRVVSTALATLSLEVYYRLLPMYGFRNTEAQAPEIKRRE
jgi:hypothetical protein